MNRIRYGVQTHFMLETPPAFRLISYWKRLSLEILSALAQDKKALVAQIRKWLSEKDDVKKK